MFGDSVCVGRKTKKISSLESSVWKEGGSNAGAMAAGSKKLSASGTVVYEMCMGGFDRSLTSAGEDLDGSKREAVSTTFSTLRKQYVLLCRACAINDSSCARLRSSRQEASECRYRLQQAENAVNNVTMLLNAKSQSYKELEKKCEVLEKQIKQLSDRASKCETVCRVSSRVFNGE